MIFHENHLLADDSHEIHTLFFFFKLTKMSAAVVIGAFSTKIQMFFSIFCLLMYVW